MRLLGVSKSFSRSWLCARLTLLGDEDLDGVDGHRGDDGNDGDSHEGGEHDQEGVHGGCCCLRVSELLVWFFCLCE
jgi:hypothetical protein